MKRKYLIVLCCMFLVLFSSAVYASEPGPYLSVQGGVTFLDDITFSGPGTGGVDVNVESNTGFGILGAVGYDFGMYRLEGELGYRKNDYDTMTNPTGSAAAEGDQTVWSFMVNGIVDIENDTPFTPYFLLGLGWASLDVNEIKAAGDPTASNYDDSTFAYQFGVGVGYAVTESVTLDLSYRYFATSDPSYDDPAGAVDGEYSTHNIFFGARFAF
ncbi:MAG: outer membrane protein [Pseudomonadota bacterium]